MTDPAGGSTPPPPPSNWGQNTGPGPGAAAPAGFQVAPVAAGPAPGIMYADTVQRVIAYIIDVIIFFVVGVIIIGAIVASIFATGGFGLGLVGVIVLGVLSLVGSAIYFIYTWTRMRASIGQRVLGLETVNAADGATLTQDQAIKRWAYLFGPSAVGQVLGYSGSAALGAIGSLVGLLALLYQIYLLYTVTQDPKRQGFHDKQVGSVVVKRTVA